MTPKNRIFVILLFITLSVLFGYGNVFTLLFVGLIIGGIVLISLILFLIGIIFNKQKLHSYSSKILGLSVLLIAATLITSNVRKNLKEENAKEIIVALKNYKSTNGFYPDSLSVIGYDNKIYIYYPAKNQEEFEIRYIIDGWHYNQYSSRTDEWQAGD